MEEDKKMSFTLQLPTKNGEIESQEFQNNSIIIIGANGAGKSRLGAWIENRDLNNVHRVGAQRSLEFNEYINLKSYEQSENLLLTGKEELDQTKSYRWKWGKYTTALVADFDAVLSTLVAKKNLDNDNYIKECKEFEYLGKKHNPVPRTDIDKLYEIWEAIYPHRNIKIEDAQVKVEYNGSVYKGTEMSDGERVALYLIGQCLAVPENKILIIDEPEVHLHRSIMNKLWKAIEENRPDCFFIYITHDTQFAAGHAHSKKLWVKDYDGSNWRWEFVNESDLPEECLLDILGNRKNVLFVEGTQDSYDTKIYKEIFNDYYVVPCGSCTKVIEYTKAMNSNSQLHHLKAIGLIDRDYRSKNEIDVLKENNIFVLEIAEVENLFCVEEILNVINSHQGFTDFYNIDKVKKYIIEERFSKQIKNQICKAVISEIKYLLSTYDLNGKDLDTVRGNFDSINNKILFEDIKKKIEERFENALNKKDYETILKLFNEKGLSKSIGLFFKIRNEDYCDLIIRLLKSKQSDDIVDGIKKYLPDFFQ